MYYGVNADEWERNILWTEPSRRTPYVASPFSDASRPESPAPSLSPGRYVNQELMQMDCMQDILWDDAVPIDANPIVEQTDPVRARFLFFSFFFSFTHARALSSSRVRAWFFLFFFLAA
jgi:hypothetical protein